MCWTPFCSSGGPNGPTERAPIKYCLMEVDITADGGGHVLRTNTLLLSRGMAYPEVIVRCDLAGEAEDSGWTSNKIFTPQVVSELPLKRLERLEWNNIYGIHTNNCC